MDLNAVMMSSYARKALIIMVLIDLVLPLGMANVRMERRLRPETGSPIRTLARRCALSQWAVAAATCPRSGAPVRQPFQAGTLINSGTNVCSSIMVDALEMLTGEIEKNKHFKIRKLYLTDKIFILF